MSLKIFVADDSVTTQKVVGLAFSGEDVTIEAASNGNAALDSIKKFHPDIVLADVLMPGCNGYEVCAKIKESPELSGIPVILLVGTFEPFDEAEAARAKSDGHLTKPFDTSELTQMIRSLTDSRAETPKGGNQARSQQRAGIRGMVSTSVMQSYLGSNRILDLFGSEAFDAYAESPLPRENQAASAGGEVLSGENIPEDVLNTIVEKVIRRMSNEVVREIAWEVVPELSEAIIRRSLKEQK